MRAYVCVMHKCWSSYAISNVRNPIPIPIKLSSSSSYRFPPSVPLPPLPFSTSSPPTFSPCQNIKPIRLFREIDVDGGGDVSYPELRDGFLNILGTGGEKKKRERERERLGEKERLGERDVTGMGNCGV